MEHTTTEYTPHFQAQEHKMKLKKIITINMIAKIEVGIVCRKAVTFALLTLSTTLLVSTIQADDTQNQQIREPLNKSPNSPDLS